MYRKTPTESSLYSTNDERKTTSVLAPGDSLLKKAAVWDRSRTIGCHLVVPAILGLAVLISTPQTAAAAAATASAQPHYQEWTLGNGTVKLPLPLTIGGFQLRDPALLGSGGGGAVFAMDRTGSTPQYQKDSDRVALKVSWDSSAKSVLNECRILQVMEANRVSGVEHCLASAPYPTASSPTADDAKVPSSQRVMIVMRPVLEDNHVINSIGDLQSPVLQRKAVQQVIQTLLQMLLAAKVATTDVQPLISAATGQVLFIDMTEAQVLSQPPTFLDLALCGAFVSEMMAFVPESMHGIAAQIFDEELLVLSQSKGGESSLDRVPDKVKAIVKEQVTFLSQQSLNMLD